MKINTRNLAVQAMLSAIAYLAMLLIHIKLIPGAPFLTFDPKDTVIVLGGFLFGPLPAIMITVVVAFAEMITISTTGWIGLVMNIISSLAFVLPATMVYKWKRSLPFAVAGLIIGCISVTATMLLWNYLIVPLYMPNITREAIIPMLTSIFLPFNLIKSALNASVAMLLYKPLVTALRRAGLYDAGAQQNISGKFNIVAPLVSGFTVLTLVLVVMAMMGVI